MAEPNEKNPPIEEECDDEEYATNMAEIHNALNFGKTNR
jgi:hypothetical protein